MSCLLSAGPCSETPENIDYDFAQQELMMQQFMNDPIQEAITSVEKQHEEDKQGEYAVGPSIGRSLHPTNRPPENFY